MAIAAAAPARTRGYAHAASRIGASVANPLTRWSAAVVPAGGWRKLSSTTCRATSPMATRKTSVERAGPGLFVVVGDGMSASEDVMSRR